MRNKENLFRGRLKHRKNKDYIFGNLFQQKEQYFIINKDQNILDLIHNPNNFEVDVDTIDEFTGLCDREGLRIFTKDRTEHVRFGVSGTWEFNEHFNCFLMIDDDGLRCFYFSIDSKDLRIL